MAFSEYDTICTDLWKVEQTNKIEMQEYLDGKCPDDKKKKKKMMNCRLSTPAALSAGEAAKLNWWMEVYERVKTQTDVATLHIDLWIYDRLM